MNSLSGSGQADIDEQLARFFADIDDEDEGSDMSTAGHTNRVGNSRRRPRLVSEDESPPPVAGHTSNADPSRRRGGGQPSDRTQPETFRARRTAPSRSEVIDLSALSDDDDVEVTGGTIPPRRPQGPRPTPLNLSSIPPPVRSSDATNPIPTIERLLAQQRSLEERSDAVIAALQRRQEQAARAVESYNNEAARVRASPIRFGGAVLQQGNRRLHYEPLPIAPAPQPTGNRLMSRADRQLLERLGAMPSMRILLGLGDGLAAGTSRAMGGQRFQDPQTIVDSVGHFTYPKAAKRFTRDFKIPEPPVTLNEDGQPVESAPFEQYLSCAKCDEYLRVQSGVRDPDDRIFALTCGHLVDQRCLHELSIPTTEAQLAAVVRPGDTPLDAPSPKRRRTRQRKKRRDPETFVWFCPIKDCGQGHTSAKFPDTEDWVTYEGAGATQLYV